MKTVISTVKCRDEDELFKTLSEELPVGVCIMQDGKFCYLNSTFPVAIGYTIDELVAKDSLEIVVPEDREMVEENTMKMLKGELRSPYQFRVICKDGNIVWVMGTVKSIQYHGRRAVLGNYMEVTERKLVEEAIRQSEERYKELANSITDVFFAMDEHMRYTYWNRASEVLTGIRAKYAIGKSIEEVFPDRSWRRMAEEMYRKVVKTQQLQSFVNDYDIDGRHYILESNAYPSQGGVSVFVKDITDRKQAEEALRESEERYRKMFEEALDAIFIGDAETGMLLDCNRAACELVGRARSGLIGKHHRILHPQGGTEGEFSRTFSEHLCAKEGELIETQVVTRKREIKEVAIKANVLEFRGKKVIQGIFRDITKRKQTEEALRRSEERYRTMLEEMEEGYYEVDIAGNFTFVNDAMSRILGYSQDELIGMNYKTYTPKEDVKPIFQAYNRVYRTGEPLKWFPMPEIRKDGTRILAEDSVFPLRNENGDVIAFRGISRDITEHKQAEEALRQSEERYRTILEETGDGYFETDLAGNFTFVNDAQARLLSCSKKEIIGVNYGAFTPEEKAESVFKAYKRIYETGEPLINFPDEVIRKDGSRGFAETSAFPIRNDKGEIVGFRGVRRDITDYKEAEEALRQSEERYRTILEEMEDSYFEVDLGGHLTFVNSSTCRNLGYSEEELIGMSFKCFTATEDIEAVFRVFNEVYRSGVPNKGFPWKIIRKDGGHGFAEASISPLRSDTDEIIGFRGVGRDVTERKQAEEALNTQRAYFQQLFDTSPDAIIMMDTNDRAIQVNKGFERLFGYYDKEARGRSLIELIVPGEDAQEASESLERIVGGETVRKERVRRRKDDSLVDVSVLAYPIYSDGKLIGAYGVYTDISERKRQEQALADELTRRRLLIDQSLDGIVVLDIDAGVVEANQRFAEMLGYTMKEVYKLHTWDWDKNFPPEKILDMGRNVDEKGFRLETKHTRKDGSVIDVDISINGATCTGQKLIFCVSRDVTTRKKMSEALELAAEEWSRTFDSISDAVSIHDRNFRIQRANKAFADLFGKNPHEIIGIHCYELRKENEPRSGCPHQYTLTSGKPAAAEFYESYLGKYLLESTSPILNERGETVGAVHITRDITEQKRQNERLMMTDRLASLGELASGTAHELNNPLTSIIGFSQLIMEREVPDDIREDLKLINTEAQRAANVTKNLLTFARKHAPVKQLSQINSIIEDVLTLRAYEHKANNIEVVKRLHPDLPEMMVDYFQMQQVFMNIIINAEYFMTAAHKKGTLTITTKRQNSSVVVSFADDGPGIPPENLKRIFDPFFTTKETGKGTGLGLSICHGIVTEHGGQIYARSQFGKGATILVGLPVNGVHPDGGTR